MQEVVNGSPVVSDALHLKLWPKKQYGRVPELDNHIIFNGHTISPKGRYQVGEEFLPNLTLAREKVATTKGIPIDSDLHSVVEYTPGSGHKRPNAKPHKETEMKKKTANLLPRASDLLAVTPRDQMNADQLEELRLATKREANDRYRAKKNKAAKRAAAKAAKAATTEVVKTTKTRAPYGSKKPRNITPAPEAQQSVMVGPRFQVAMPTNTGTMHVGCNDVKDLDAVFTLVKKHLF